MMMKLKHKLEEAVIAVEARIKEMGDVPSLDTGLKVVEMASLLGKKSALHAVIKEIEEADNGE